MLIRKDEFGIEHVVLEDTALYIDRLLTKLRIARELADATDRLNPKVNEIGPGYMANMKELAKQLL